VRAIVFNVLFLSPYSCVCVCVCCVSFTFLFGRRFRHLGGPSTVDAVKLSRFDARFLFGSGLVLHNLRSESPVLSPYPKGMVTVQGHHHPFALSPV